jgi:endogenous inhibitor of DNA gyrase (YacG/DUF329 family)
MAAVARCSICNKPVLARSQNPMFPFCSERCRFVDLGKWLGEEYRVPDQTPDDQEDEAPHAPGDVDAEKSE